MNEVTRIHLGRQPYTISVEAHKSLKDYLAAIEKKVGDQEVINEVELRMSELLTERGVASDKVILPADVTYLKEQLGNPTDFSDDTDETPSEPQKSDDRPPRKLFRNTDTALIAGVASGLASYSGLDVTIIRLLFVVAAIFGSGLGVVVYILLWLIVPAAETTSEKLQMQGKPVTLEALKESVDKADVPGAARRVNRTLLPIINGIFRVCIVLVGCAFTAVGLLLLSGVAVVKTYMLLHHGRLFQENLFPVGVREQWLAALVMVLVVIVAAFLLLSGIATFKRKWPVRAWITGILAGLFVVGAAASIALAADAAPHVRDRYEASLHTTAVKNIQPFNKVTTTGEVDIAYISSPSYAVNVHYSGNPNLSKLKVHVVNNTLYIDSSALDAGQHCTMLCLFPRYDMTVQVYAPNVKQFVTPPQTDIFYPARPALGE